MSKAYEEEVKMLQELDCMWHAHGVGLCNFMRIGRWVELVGKNWQISVLRPATIESIRTMHARTMKKWRNIQQAKLIEQEL